MRQGWLGREDSFTATRKLDLYQRLFLEWSAVLKPSEIVVVGWLISNTVWRGRRSGSYSLTQLTKGIPKKDGTGFWAKGCGLSKRTIQGVLLSLQSRAILSAVRGQRATVYSVNVDWCPETENAEGAVMGENVVRFPVSGRIVRVAKSAPECGNICHSSIGDEQEEDVKVYNRESENSNERDYHVDFEKVWHEAMQSLEYPTTNDVEWTKKIAGMVARGLAGWPQGHDRLQAFIVWAVSNWNLIITNQMSWMDRVTKPDKPDPEFFARHIRHFAAAWLDLERTRWIETLPETERAIETKIRQGMSREGATLEVAKEQFLVADRNERARDIRLAEETYRMAKLEADRARGHPFNQE